jgi:uncharacterized protein
MPYQILCLDGGGAWALIEVRALMGLFGQNATGHQVLQNFDLVAANSGGSLVLAGLVENLPLAAILQYFLDEHHRRSIFSPTNKLSDDVLRLALGIVPARLSTIHQTQHPLLRMQLQAAKQVFSHLS